MSSVANTNEAALKRNLKNRYIQLLALGVTIGTGLMCLTPSIGMSVVAMPVALVVLFCAYWTLQMLVLVRRLKLQLL